MGFFGEGLKISTRQRNYLKYFIIEQNGSKMNEIVESSTDKGILIFGNLIDNFNI